MSPSLSQMFMSKYLVTGAYTVAFFACDADADAADLQMLSF